MRLVAALVGVAVGLCGGCGGGDEDSGGAGNGTEAAQLFDEQLLFYRLGCTCTDRSTELASEDSACVKGYVSLTAAEQACKENVLQSQWAKVAPYGTCQINAWRAGQACVQAGCSKLESCFMDLNLEDCPPLPADVQTTYDACD
jgi:hypothetical protein